MDENNFFIFEQQNTDQNEAKTIFQVFRDWNKKTSFSPFVLTFISCCQPPT